MPGGCVPLTERDLQVDRELVEVTAQIPLLSLITPTNVREARRAFFAGEDPVFTYQELPDLSDVSRRLEQIDPTVPDDPTVSHLAEGLIKELRLRLELLRNRDTEQAFFVAMELFGHVEDKTMGLADEILSRPFERVTPERTIGADEFSLLAEAEIARYRSLYPELAAKVLLTDSRPGIMVEAGNLFLGVPLRIDVATVPGLLAHEVGTHVVTFVNGQCQPLQMLSLGLAGYDELQEAMGVFAEYLTSGLTTSRLRMLASRVLVAHRRSRGVGFRDVHSELLSLGFRRGEAFTTVMRAFRAGGNTKDAVYLRGFARLLEHIQSGVDLATLYVGKISFEAIPLIADLYARSVLVAPPLLPLFLEDPVAKERLQAVKNGERIIETGGQAA
jgi:uncharacterized protein (TIGR02421 family)